MSDDVIPMPPRRDAPVAVVRLGANQSVTFFGLVMGIATVQIAGDIEHMKFMSPETAEAIADALLKAAATARQKARAD